MLVWRFGVKEVRSREFERWPDASKILTAICVRVFLSRLKFQRWWRRFQLIKQEHPQNPSYCLAVTHRWTIDVQVEGVVLNFWFTFSVEKLIKGFVVLLSCFLVFNLNFFDLKCLKKSSRMFFKWNSAIQLATQQQFSKYKSAVFAGQ